MGKLLTISKSPEDRASIVNEYYAVDKLHDEFAPTEKRRKQLRDEIVSWCPDAEKEYSEKTDRVQLVISACGLERTVDNAAAFKVAGKKDFLTACKVSMKALAIFLTTPVIEALLISTLTGPRTFTVTPVVRVPFEAAINGTELSDRLLEAA
jgi:hypothetical protein